MQIHTLASGFSDNFFHLIEDAGQALLIDPIDPAVAMEAVDGLGLRDVRIFVTHGHADHWAGCPRLREERGWRVFAPAPAERFDIPRDETIGHGARLTVGETTFEVLAAPGHTPDHLVLWTPGHVFSGDVYFVAGIGNCVSGDPGELWRTVHERLAFLPDETVFWPGHDYAARNLAFIEAVAPMLAARAEPLRERIAAAAAAEERTLVCATLGEERAWNPFHRVGDAAFRASLAALHPGELPADASSEAAFRFLRARRDRF